MTDDAAAERIGLFTFRPTDEGSAREISGWQYAQPYTLYNCDPADAEGAVQALLDPQYRYYTLWDEAGQLAGYVGFGEDGRVPGGDYGTDALDIGGGLKPDHTGRGHGLPFMEAALVFARRHFAPAAFRVTVAAFNTRALRVCEKAGYHPIQTFARVAAPMDFVVLVRDAA
jgi:RimJ/RimL family protein N-acetyltransferase